MDFDLGRVFVTEKGAARRFIARWKGAAVHITVPPGTTSGEFARAFSELKPRLLRRRPSLQYHEGQLIDLTEAKVLIGRQQLKPNSLIVNFALPQPAILVGSGIDFCDPEATSLISRGLKRIAANMAPSALIPRGKELAALHGCEVASWSISSGMKTLGSCSSRRDIKISSACMFLPPDLRDYIICHELAHLTHFDHSPRFHALCDRYLSGQERALIARLNRFPWPVFKS